MALIESVFRRPADDRAIPFATIAAETKLPEDEVEHLVMKALSLRLVKGSLDQVDGIARIEWVQPRVLDRAQMQALRDRLDGWCAKVAQVSEYVTSQTRKSHVHVPPAPRTPLSTPSLTHSRPCPCPCPCTAELFIAA